MADTEAAAMTAEGRLHEAAEVVIVIGGRVDERTHAYDGNREGRTACGLYPDQLQSRRAWRIVPFTRCQKCDEASR